MDITTLIIHIIIIFVPNSLSAFQQYDRDGNSLNHHHLGYYLGEFSNKLEGLSAKVFIVDKSTILLKDLVFTGTIDDGVFVYVGTLDSNGGFTQTGYPLTNSYGIARPLSQSSGGANQLFQFPKGKTVFEVDWIGVISREKKALYSRLLISEDAKESVPNPLDIGGFYGRNGISSTSVILADTKHIVITDFKFNAVAPNTYFLVGQGVRPDAQGEVIPDESGSYEPLRRYEDETTAIELPDHLSVREIDWISIWSKGLNTSLAHVFLPRSSLNIPTAISELKVQPEAALNCETLNDDPGLELRWSLIDKSAIILQLVSFTSSDKYVALGIKHLENDKRSKLIGGDVIVGWINSKSGKGGIDDYFLAGPLQQCKDGAESCPDVSEENGVKNVELLGSVTRGNYTMITVRRPIDAQDLYDVPVHLDRPQDVFWSIGYKSPQMRRIHKPLKNPEPINIDFGRAPMWNCEPFEKGHDSGNLLSEGISSTTSEPFTLTPFPSNPEITTTPMRHLRKLTTTTTMAPLSTPVRVSTFIPRQIRKKAYSHKDDDYLNDQSWSIPAITCTETDKEAIYVQLGSAAHDKGNPENGQAFYVNGILAPEIHLQRGVTYTFVVETGLGSKIAQGKGHFPFHPLYITTDLHGGYQEKQKLEKMAETVYAGIRFDRDGNPTPIGFGRLCIWESSRPIETFNTYKEFHRDLTLNCPEQGEGLESGVFKFTPTNNMPNKLYYQSFTAKDMGGVIHLEENCNRHRRIRFSGIEQFRPSLDTYLKGSSLSVENPTQDEIDLLHSLVERRENRLKGQNDANIQASVNSRENCLRKRMGNSDKESLDKDGMPVFEHFPMKNSDEKDLEDFYENCIDDGPIERMDSGEDYEDYYSYENKEQKTSFEDTLYNMTPHEEMPAETFTEAPPPWEKFWHGPKFPVEPLDDTESYNESNIDTPSSQMDIIRINSYSLDENMESNQRDPYPQEILSDEKVHEVIPQQKQSHFTPPLPKNQIQTYQADQKMSKDNLRTSYQRNGPISTEPKLEQASRLPSKSLVSNRRHQYSSNIHGKPHPVPRPRPSPDTVPGTQHASKEPIETSSNPLFDFLKPLSAVLSPLKWFQGKTNPSEKPKPALKPYPNIPPPRNFPRHDSPNSPNGSRPPILLRRSQNPKSSPKQRFPPGPMKKPFKGQPYFHRNVPHRPARFDPPKPQRFDRPRQRKIPNFRIGLEEKRKPISFPRNRPSSPNLNKKDPSHPGTLGPNLEHKKRPKVTPSYSESSFYTPAQSVLPRVTTHKPDHLASANKYALSNVISAVKKNFQNDQVQHVRTTDSPPPNPTPIPTFKPSEQVKAQSTTVGPPKVRPETGGFVPLRNNPIASAIPNLAFSVLEPKLTPKFVPNEHQIPEDDYADETPTPLDYDINISSRDNFQIPAFFEYEDEVNVPEASDEEAHASSDQGAPVSEADFSDFKAVENESRRNRRRRRKKIQGYLEKDRIDRPTQPLIMDFKVGASFLGSDKESRDEIKDDKHPVRISVGTVGDPEPAYKHRATSKSTSSSSSEPYGLQFPSYVPETLTTKLGTSFDQEKELSVSDHVFYGNSKEDSDESLALDRLKRRLGLEELEDGDMIRLIKKIHGFSA